MNTELGKRRALPALQTYSIAATNYESLPDPLDPAEPRVNDSRTPRVISGALRSLSTSSLDSLSSNSIKSTHSTRKLHKTLNGSGSMIERIHRRVSKDLSGNSMSSFATEGPSAPLQQPLSVMELLSYGHLKTDVSLLKARSEYLVLTSQCLVKLVSIEAAKAAFPQLGHPGSLTRRGSTHSLGSKSSEIRFEIPLHSIVAVFKEEGAGTKSGIEIWWFSPWPRLAYCRAHLFFSLPKERDEWLLDIQTACKARFRRTPVSSFVPENLRTRINHIIRTTESPPVDCQNLIFPVAKRAISTSHKGSSTDDGHLQVDLSSFYFAIGPCMCYLVEVLKADCGMAPGELRVKSHSFGTVTLARFKASVACQEQRFFMSFRSPFGNETRLELASIHYRRVIEALTRADRILKPMWPQHFQQIVFNIEGLPPPLRLTLGNDLGGAEQSLRAHCTAFHVDVPKWTVEWNTSCPPMFRLVPIEGYSYSPLQLMAVFRALRYNTYFKAVSFQGVCLSVLAGKKDPSSYGEGVVYTSINGSEIPDEDCDALLRAPVLTQEIFALAFASESIRCIDLSDTVGIHTYANKNPHGLSDSEQFHKGSSEILRPFLMLLRDQLGMCDSILMSGNSIAQSDVDDLANTLKLDHVHIKRLKLAGCTLGDRGLSRIWAVLHKQGASLQVLDTSNNQGTVAFKTIGHALSCFKAIRKLNIGGNTRIVEDGCLFDANVLHSWTLEELDLSGIVLNDATVDCLAGYLRTARSKKLQTLRLNKCGLTGTQLGRLFFSMGQARQLTIHINSNRPDDGIDDLCEVIASGSGPWSVFMQMVEFSHEESYVKLWKALTINKTIECLSLAGSAPPEALSISTCQVVRKFFEINNTVRFLDISGYDSKLDEGRLGKRFSRALSGIRSNTRIEHLRVRNQMLNYNIGDLAEAISHNDIIHTLDCEDNDFNISNLRHLIKHLAENITIRYFSAFSKLDLERSVKKSVCQTGSTSPIRRNSMISRFRADKIHKATPDSTLIQQLRDEWDAAVIELGAILERNQRFHQLSRRASDGDSEASTRIRRRAEGTFSESFGGLASREFESRNHKNSQCTVVRLDPGGSNNSSLPELQNFREGMVGRSNSVISSEAALSPISASSLESSKETLNGSTIESSSPKERAYTVEAGVSGHRSGESNRLLDGASQMTIIQRQFEAVGRIDEEDHVC